MSYNSDPDSAVSMCGETVPECSERLVSFEPFPSLADAIGESLRRDAVVLVRNIQPDEADRLVYEVSRGFGLAQSLEVQAGFAGLEGRRNRVGEYFMTVNDRGNHQFISPHSEGNSFIGMQLASFYCYENSTDGGESILLNINDSSAAWSKLREKVKRARIGIRTLARHEILRARGLYQLNLPADVLKDDDEVLSEAPSQIPGLSLITALARPRRTLSQILQRDVYSFWYSVESIDFDSACEFERLLRQCGLLREPDRDSGLQLDHSADQRIRHSGVLYIDLFKSKLTRKLCPGDLIIQNNLTWAHGAANWSPRSGVRNIVASFA